MFKSLTGSTIKQQRQRAMIARYIVAVIAIFFSLFPVFFIASAAFNPTGSLSANRLIPATISLQNFEALFNDSFNPFMLWLVNSLKIAAITSVLAVLLTALAAYAFSRFRFRGRRALLLSLVLVQIFPNMLLIVALYLLILQLGKHIPMLGLNSHGGLILVYLGGVMSINVWLMKGFFDSIPRDLDESAKVDGASDWQIFWLIIFPLVRPIMAVIAVLTFVGVFNDFLIASVFLQDKEELTFMVGLYQFISNQFNQSWGIFAAGALIGSIPIVIIYLILQDQIVSGLTSGSVKG